MNRLKFEGKGFDFFKILFVDVILNIVSLTLLYPRALVREAQYLWSESSLGGTPFEFRGKTKVAFNGYMKVLLFVVIYFIIILCEVLIFKRPGMETLLIMTYLNTLTMVIFIFIMIPLILHGDLNFFAKNTSWRSVSASYTGRLSDLTGITMSGNILTMLTLGIYTAWYETQLYKYIMEHLQFGSLRFGYRGSSKELFRIYLKGFLLGIVTLGIYHIWSFRDLYNYTVNHTVVRKGDQEFSLHSDANTRQVFEMLVGNVLLIVLTLGFGASWACMRFFRFMLNHCVIPAEFNLDAIEDKELDEEPQKPSYHWLDKWNPTLIA